MVEHEPSPAKYIVNGAILICVGGINSQTACGLQFSLLSVV